MSRMHKKVPRKHCIKDQHCEELGDSVLYWDLEFLVCDYIR